VFVNYKSGLVMDVSGVSTADDVPIVQWALTSTTTSSTVPDLDLGIF